MIDERAENERKVAEILKARFLSGFWWGFLSGAGLVSILYILGRC